MKKILLTLISGAFVLSLIFSSTPEEATAYPQFQKAFVKEYPALKDVVMNKETGVKCFLCHGTKLDPKTKKMSKKSRNAYGAELDKLVEKKDKKKANKANVIKALKEIESKKAEGADKTYGELIKAGKLPLKIVVPPKKKDDGDDEK